MITTNYLLLLQRAVASGKLLADVCYYLLVALIFTVLLTAEIIRCFSPLVATLRYQVERTTEWYSLPTVTPNWHTHLADQTYHEGVKPECG